MAMGDLERVYGAIKETLPLLKKMWRRHIGNSKHRNMWPDDLSGVCIGLLYGTPPSGNYYEADVRLGPE